MTDETRPVPGEDTDETEPDADASAERGKQTNDREEPNPWLKEGADAPDAADIEDPTEQR